MMDWLFGRRMTPDEMLRKNQRALNKAMRELDRERAKMEQQEKKIIADIKKMAKQGQMDAVKIMAKVRIFKQLKIFGRKKAFFSQLWIFREIDCLHANVKFAQKFDFMRK